MISNAKIIQIQLIAHVVSKKFDFWRKLHFLLDFFASYQNNPYFCGKLMKP